MKIKVYKKFHQLFSLDVKLCHIKAGTQIEGVWELDAENKIQERSDRRLEKTAY
jgi:hypothetical protein